MNEVNWKSFFELLDLIVNQEGTWSQKRDEVMAKALDADASATLEEFVDWFGGDATPTV